MDHRNNLIKFWVALGLLVLFGYYVSVSNKVEPAKQKETVKVAYTNDTIDYDLLLDIANDQGFADKNGITISKLPVGKDSTDLLLTKNADFNLNSATSVLSFFLNNKGNNEIRWIAASSDYPTNSYLISRYPKDELKKIKKVGVKRIGGADQVVMAGVLKSIGPDAQTEYMSTNDEKAKITLIKRGELDAIVVRSAKARDEVAKSGDYYISNVKEVLGEIKIPSGIITLEEVLKNKSVASKGFVKSIEESIGYIKANRAATIEFIQGKYSIDEKEAKETYDGLVSSFAADYSPKAENLKDVTEIVKEVFGLKSDKKVQDFIYTDLSASLK